MICGLFYLGVAVRYESVVIVVALSLSDDNLFLANALGRVDGGVTSVEGFLGSAGEAVDNEVLEN